MVERHHVLKILMAGSVQQDSHPHPFENPPDLEVKLSKKFCREDFPLACTGTESFLLSFSPAHYLLI